MKKTYALLVITLISGCRFNITSPSPPNITINNSNNNTNDNTNNVSPVTPIIVLPPSNPTNPTPPTNGSPTNPTIPIALPTTAQATILSLGQQYSALVHECSYLFIDALLANLRPMDARWGYVCKRGNCSDISLDVIAYHAGGGSDTRGATGTYEIDVIGNSCSPAATPQFLNLGYAATNVFSPTR